MFVPEIIEAHPLENFAIQLRFADGVVGEVDLSYLAGKGVFTFWDQYENFRNVSVINGRRLAWSRCGHTWRCPIEKLPSAVPAHER